ncbi:MAG TPA: carbonic anhydrase family protein [Candidatus Eisenbacteria bacterium]|nr:carbonic anhydrase family protein [Candidatus Eisenbacteria bacterium]
MRYTAVKFVRSGFLFLPLLLPCLIAAQEAKPHWSYKGSAAPADWGKLDPAYATCSSGKTQSPIDIKGAKPADLPALKMDYKTVPFNIIDNGHTIQVNYPAGSTLTVGDHVYTLKQFHFHHPSEEHVNGKKFELVAHLVHADADGHLAVVAILFNEGAANPVLDKVWKNIPSTQEKAIDVPDVTINAGDLLPSNLGYFTYAGSLTTPPCSEGVTWFVLKTTDTLSKAEVAAFAKHYPMNARPIQPTNGREIRESQ